MTDTNIGDLLDKLNTLKGSYSEDTILNINTDSVTEYDKASRIQEVLQSKGRTIKDLITLGSECSPEATILNDYLVIIEETIIDDVKALVLRFVINQMTEEERKEFDKRYNICLILDDIGESAQELSLKTKEDPPNATQITDIINLCYKIETLGQILRKISND